MKKFGLAARILLIGLIPVLIDILVLTTVSITSMRTAMESESEIDSRIRRLCWIRHWKCI